MSRHPIIAVVTAGYVVAWTAVGLAMGSDVALAYLVEMVVLIPLVARLDRHRNLSTWVLAGLSLWGFMHMAGGDLLIDGNTLYETWLLPVLRWDHVVHAVGFGFAGVAVYELFEPWLVVPVSPAAAFWIAFLGGSAIGGLNEAIEFLASQVLPFANIGDETNTGLDLISNTVGCLVAAWLVVRRVRAEPVPAQTTRS